MFQGTALPLLSHTHVAVLLQHGYVGWGAGGCAVLEYPEAKVGREAGLVQLV